MDIRGADLPLLVSLDALLTERSVSRAAARVGLSQPAMSAQLARLRALFGDRLLVPSGRQMVPTARALAVQGPLRERVAALGELLRAGRDFDPATEARVFRVAGSDLLHRLVMLPFMAGLAREAPRARVALLPFDPATAWAVIAEDRADFLLGSRRLIPGAARHAVLFEEDFVLVHRAGLAGAGLDWFCAQGHVLVSVDGGGGFVGAIDTALAEIGRARRVVASVPSFLLVPELLRGSDLVAVLPRRLAAGLGDWMVVGELPLRSPRFEVLLGWHERRHADPALRWARSRLVESFVLKE